MNKIQKEIQGVIQRETIVGRYAIEDLVSKQDLLPHHKAGLMYTRTGYGNKIPTTTMVQLPGSKRWRRVYCCIFSNIGTRYVTKGDDWIVVY